MSQSNTLENFWKKVKSKEIKNYLIPISLHQNLAYTVQMQDRTTTLLWLPYEYTGIAYMERSAGSVDIFPYYKSQIIEEFEISHGMDLYKPKTEEAILLHMYKNSWDLHRILSQDKYGGSAADYLYKFHHICIFLKYFNSARAIPTNQKLSYNSGA